MSKSSRLPDGGRAPAGRPRQGAGDYRIFIGAFPTGPLAERIQAVRLHFDPKTAAITAPHVTLAGTYWRTGAAVPESEAALIDRLQAASSSLPPFELLLGGIHTFGSRVVYLGVTSTPSLLALRRALMGIAGPDKHCRYRPHLTLAMRLSRLETEAMVADLQQSEWETGRFIAPIEALQLMQRGPEDAAWRTIACLPLASGRSGPAQ